MATLTAACSGVVGASTPSVHAPPPVERHWPAGPSALADPAHPGLPDPLIDPDEIVSGGPPPDGISPIDEPSFVTTDEADVWHTDADPVACLEVGGKVHAYPVQVLIWHEIVNDTVGGVPVAVTYCPLCNSAVGYRRTVDGVETTFGTSGRLYASALIMYDRATESLWTHFDGRAVAGILAGRVLDPIPSPLLAWSEFHAALPDAMVLDRAATGFERPYGENPYVRYDRPDSIPRSFTGSVDNRALPRQRVVGVAIGDAARAWTLEAISDKPALATNTRVGATPTVILWKAGQVTALETHRIVSGRDVGSVGVFDPVVGGARLSFAARGDGFFDVETGSEWDPTGTAISGPLTGARLDRIHHFDTFWFAWATYHPGTDLVVE